MNEAAVRSAGEKMRENKRIVAIYARVSTEHEAQLSALDNQIQYYDNLLKMHSDWELYQYYIDEGITGTSIKKRKKFIQMMEDAKNGCFDLIVTREVSRFARNTVDTLQQTRLLKTYGVEVFFTDDNIWTLNDEDGELRLTIMATLAQNESKKISMRVKAGQRVSFENGVPYGNGNILGYDRVGDKYIINPEQAKTVRMIYDMYLSGMGVRKIQFKLEETGRLTATGLNRWSSGTISRILNNEFYCGTVVYRKECVRDYLEQKKRKNFGYAEQVVVEGKHEPIVTKEEFQRVKSILDSKSYSLNSRGARGKKAPCDVWCKLLKCSCHSSFNRKKWNRQNGKMQYAYQCYRQIKTGTVRTRLNKGLSIEGICNSPMIPRWKLCTMADVIFQLFWDDRDGVLTIANEMLEKHIGDTHSNNEIEEEQNIKNKLTVIDRKLDNLVDMRISGEIEKELFLEKKNLLEQQKEKLNNNLSLYEGKGKVQETGQKQLLKHLKKIMELDFNFSTHNIPEEVIDAFVDEIIVYEDYFVWKLNFINVEARMKVEGRKNNPAISLVDIPTVCERSTGSDCPEISNSIFMLQGNPNYPLFGQKHYSVDTQQNRKFLFSTHS